MSGGGYEETERVRIRETRDELGSLLNPVGRRLSDNRVVNRPRDRRRGRRRRRRRVIRRRALRNSEEAT